MDVAAGIAASRSARTRLKYRAQLWSRSCWLPFSAARRTSPHTDLGLGPAGREARGGRARDCLYYKSHQGGRPDRLNQGRTGEGRGGTGAASESAPGAHRQRWQCDHDAAGFERAVQNTRRQSRGNSAPPYRQGARSPQESVGKKQSRSIRVPMVRGAT